jgi:hypothetical protein
MNDIEGISFSLRFDAETTCQSYGSDVHLASCLSEKELMFLANKNQSGSGEYFIGVSDM